MYLSILSKQHSPRDLLANDIKPESFTNMAS